MEQPAVDTFKLNPDLAEDDPDQDELGYRPLAQNIARGICTMAPTTGITIAITGDWGSGKTTMINFVKHFMAKLDPAFEIVDFNPWWFAGHEDLVRSLLQAIASVCKPDSPEGKKVIELLNDLAEIVDAAPFELKPNFMGFGVDLKKVAAVSLRQIRAQKPIPELKKQIGELLEQLQIRICVIIDDVDRLTVSDIRDLFRAMKAVGDLPYLTYVLALDRTVVAKALDNDFSERGEAYLEKVIQVTFDLPIPSRAGISRLFIAGLNNLLKMHDVEVLDEERFWHLYKGGIEHLLRTPRHAVRLINSLSVTLPAVLGEIEIADFLAIECCRLFWPDMYARIRANKERFSGRLSYLDKNMSQETKRFYETTIAPNAPEWHKPFLTKLFPKLGSVLGNYTHDSESETQWRRNLYVCSPDYFDVYFNFSIEPGEAAMADIRTFIEFCNDGKAREKLAPLLASASAEDKNKLWSMIERLGDHMESLTESGATSLYLVLMELWPTYRAVEATKQRQPLGLDNEYLLLQRLSACINRCSSDKRRNLIQLPIKQGQSPALNARLMQVLGADQHDHGPNSPELVVSNEDFEQLTETFSKAVVDWIDQEAIVDPGVLCRILYFLSPRKPSLLPLVVSRIKRSTHGLVALINFGTQTSTSITNRKAPQEFRFDLEQIAKLADPKEIAVELASRLSDGKIPPTELEIVTSFLNRLSSQASHGETEQ